MPSLKLLEMDIDNKMIYFRKDDKLIAFDADVAIGLISDSLDGNHVEVVRCKDCRYCTTNTTVMTTQTLVHCNAHRIMTEWDGYCYKGERR